MMDFILKKEIPSVKVAKKFNEGIYYCSEKGFNFMGKTIENIDCQSFVLKGNDLFYYDETGKFCYIRENENQVIDNVGFFSETIENDTILLRYDNNYDSINDVFTFKVGLYNLSTQNRIRRYEKMDNLGVYFKVDSHFICGRASNRNVIVDINSVTDIYHWEVDLGVYISSVLGVFADKLWIYTGTNELISLALDTGQMLQRIHSNDLHPSVSDANLVTYAVHFEATHGRVTFLKDRDYLEFDLATCQVTRQKSFDTCNPQTDWAFSVSSIDDNHCYFVGNQGRDAGFAQWVGVLNRATLEVEWSEHLGKHNPRNYWALNKAPLSDGSKLYVHDSEGTLHIFEKTEEN